MVWSRAKRPWISSCLFILAQTFKFWTSNAILVCEMKENKAWHEYELSPEATAGIVFKKKTTKLGGNVEWSHKTNMQIFQCSCPPDSTQTEYFGDNDVGRIDNEFYKKNSFDWSVSSLFRIFNCNKLSLNFREDNGAENTLSYLLAGSVLLLENIKDLSLEQFSVGRSGYNFNDETFTSIYFRNVMFSRIPGNLLRFEEKAEILFSHIGIIGTNALPFSIQINNQNSSKNPIFILTDSNLPGIDLAKDLGKSSVTIDIVNEQKKLSNTGTELCNLDTKGHILIKNNKFGYLKTDDIFIDGGSEVMFQNNVVSLMQNEAIMFKDIKRSSVRQNDFIYTENQPNILYQFKKSGYTASCDDDDLSEDSVTQILFEMNRFSSLEDAKIIGLEIDTEYSATFLDKFVMNQNRLKATCNCSTNSTNFGDELSADEQVVAWRFLFESHCRAKMPMLMGPRKEICSGTLPKTKEQHRQEVRYQVVQEYTAYLVLAIFLSILLTAVITAIVVRMLCTSPDVHSGGRSSSSRRRLSSTSGRIEQA